VLKTWMIAEYLRPYAQWRINRADPCDDGRNARAAIGLIDAAAYVTHLDERERVIVRMDSAGCFALGHFDPGIEGETLVRHWHYDKAEDGPAELFEALAVAAERGRRAASLARAKEGEAAPA